MTGLCAKRHLKRCAAAFAFLVCAGGSPAPPASAAEAQSAPSSKTNAPAPGIYLELGQRYERLEWVHVTPEYSNAVLSAVLPQISDVAQRLELPVPRPVKGESVVHCSVLPNRRVEAEVGIMGGWVFAFKFGFVQVIQGPHSYYALQDPDEIPKYFGEVRMSRPEAIRLARETLKKLGIPLEAVFAEQEPRVTEPVKIGTNTVPHYRIEWLDPGQGVVGAVDMDVNGSTKRVERVSFGANRNLERPPPRVNVVPPRDARFGSGPLANPEYAWRLIPIVLRALDEYGQKLSLPIPRPLTTNHVAKFSLGDNGGWPHSEIELTNGWRFIYRNSMVNGFYAPDNLFTRGQRGTRIKDFVGKWNVTESEAIGLVRRTIAKLDYPSNLVHMDFAPQVIKPAVPGIPRYWFWWYYENQEHTDLQSKVEAEVDADKGELKSLYYDDKAFWNKPPPIDVSISLPLSADTTTRTGTPRPKGQAQPNAEPPSRPFKVPQDLKPL